MNLAKAFYTVDQCIYKHILLNKLHCLGLDVFTQNWFNVHLSGGKQAICTDGVKTNTLRINKGYHKSVLGPFLLFTLDINTPTQSYNIHFYADDTVLYAFGSS